jgi:hypothetical protein
MNNKIELGGIVPDKNSVQTIKELQQSFHDWLKECPELAEKVKAELLSIAGYDEKTLSNDGWVIIKAPIDQLPAFGTFCGSKNNKAFSKNVLDFLRDKKVEFVLALTDGKDPRISSAIIELGYEDGEALGEMISINGGSLRSEKSRIEGWSTFESE